MRRISAFCFRSTGFSPQPTAFTSRLILHSLSIYTWRKSNFRRTSFAITAGGLNILTAETGEKTVTSKTAYYHENFNVNTKVNDIAVIKLLSPFSISKLLISKVLITYFLYTWNWTKTNVVCQSLGLYINVVRLPKLSEASKTYLNSAASTTKYDIRTELKCTSYLCRSALLFVNTCRYPKQLFLEHRWRNRGCQLCVFWRFRHRYRNWVEHLHWSVVADRYLLQRIKNKIFNIEWNSADYWCNFLDW